MSPRTRARMLFDKAWDAPNESEQLIHLIHCIDILCAKYIPPSDIGVDESELNEMLAEVQLPPFHLYRNLYDQERDLING